MVMGYKKTDSPRGPAKEKEFAESKTGVDKDDACRCKEASKMPPRELLKLMISDLAFWKKAKK